MYPTFILEVLLNSDRYLEWKRKGKRVDNKKEEIKIKQKEKVGGQKGKKGKRKEKLTAVTELKEKEP